MRHRASPIFIVAALVMAATARAASTSTVEPPVTYADCGRPSLIVTLTDTPTGPHVTLRRPGRPDAGTIDANLAHKSRRLFFKLRDEAAIVEFQGRATASWLDGLLSEGDNSRPIRLMAVPNGTCEKH